MNIKLLRLLYPPNRFYRNVTVYEGAVDGGCDDLTPITEQYKGDPDEIWELKDLGYVTYQELPIGCPKHSEFVITLKGRVLINSLGIEEPTWKA